MLRRFASIPLLMARITIGSVIVVVRLVTLEPKIDEAEEMR